MNYITPITQQLRSFKVRKGESSISGLSSGAFMTVQMHLAYSSSFCGAGIVAGGPFRCAEVFRASAILAEDAYVQNALYIAMNPLIPSMAPDAAKLAEWARAAAAEGLIDDIANLADDRLYIFTGSRDTVVYSDVVDRTRAFYELLGVPSGNVRYVDDIPAGHSLITDNPEDPPLGDNRPPYINNGGFMQSHDILRHIYPDLASPVERLTGEFIRFDQSEFVADGARASMSPFAYAYVPRAVLDGAEARVHIALHGCKQGYNFTSFVNGRPDAANQPTYGNRYFTSTGYNHIADSNDIIVLYPQAQGSDGGDMQNPDGCWDWWGYSSRDPENPDYFGRDAVQLRAINAMLERLGG